MNFDIVIMLCNMNKLDRFDYTIYRVCNFIRLRI